MLQTDILQFFATFLLATCNFGITLTYSTSPYDAYRRRGKGQGYAVVAK